MRFKFICYMCVTDNEIPCKSVVLPVFFYLEYPFPF